MLSTLVLSRIQFAMTITFHIIFPALSIGLATYIVLLEGLWLKSKKQVYGESCRFFSKILALTFGMGVISGLAMAFQLGTNWAGFSRIVGPVLGVLFTAETLTAFFIEATFLGFMLFAWGRVNRYFHFFCSIMVWIGVTLSAFWILAANSWMQTPAGVSYVHHHFVVHSWWLVIFNPSTVVRYIHMVLAAWISALTLVAGISCYYLWRQQHRIFANKNLRLSVGLLCLLLPLQVLIGDEVGLKVHQYQPIKTAAIEGVWHTTRGAPLLLFADIDQAHQTNHFTIGIAHLASLINTHQWNGRLQGLDSVPKSQQPIVVAVFYSFRIMVALGFLVLFMAVFVRIKLFRGSKLGPRLLKFMVYLSPAGILAMISGWYTAEIGRQPWVVYGLLKTSKAVSSAVTPDKVALGFVVIIVVYGFLFGYCYNKYLLSIIKHGPKQYIDIPKNSMKRFFQLFKNRQYLC